MTTPMLHQQPISDRFFDSVNGYELIEAMNTPIRRKFSPLWPKATRPRQRSRNVARLSNAACASCVIP